MYPTLFGRQWVGLGLAGWCSHCSPLRSLSLQGHLPVLVLQITTYVRSHLNKQAMSSENLQAW